MVENSDIEWTDHPSNLFVDGKVGEAEFAAAWDACTKQLWKMIVEGV